MLTEHIFEQRKLAESKNTFEKNQPFRFVVIDRFLDEAFAEKLLQEFPTLEEMNVQYKGLNEYKSEHSSFEGLPHFQQLKAILSQQKITKAIETVSGISHLQLFNDRYGYGLHQGGKNSFLDVHIDYNLHPLKKKQRRLNLILFLNKDWKTEWGGALEFWNKDVSACMQSIPPVFNRCVLFECNDHSYHGYSKITCPDHVTRKSYYQYYFSDPEQRLLFHDTVFKSRQDEKLAKKIKVSVKEKTKNVVKSAFYHLGITMPFK